MQRRTVHRLIAIILVWGIWVAIPFLARAQNPPGLSALQISLWPEYDRSSMLVIYRISLSPETSLPANLVFRIPPGGDPLVVAVGAAAETVDEVNFTQKVIGNWKELAFTATFPVIQLEYYDAGLRIEGQARHYEYRWPGDYAVDTMIIEVQQPIGATEMRIAPDLGRGKEKTNEPNVLYYTSQLGSLSVGQTFEITVDYNKSSRALTVEQMEVEPAQPIADNTPGRIQLRNIIIGGLAVGALALLVVALIVGGGLWFNRSNPKGARPERRKRSREARPAAIEAAAGGTIYCHQCGKRATPGDRFCRSCGTKLRVE